MKCIYFYKKILPFQFDMDGDKHKQSLVNKTLFFVKTYWLWFVSGITIIAVIHSIWYWQHHAMNEHFMKEFNEMLSESKKFNKFKSIGYNIGYWGKHIFKPISPIFWIVGLTILFGEANYRLIYKNLFIDEGNKGKFLYVLVLLFVYLFLRLLLNIFFGKSIEHLGVHVFFANFWLISMFIYANFAYTTESYNRLRNMAFQKTKAELVALKAQINPHFLFNVLNNLYGQAIVEDSPKTAEGIERLSRIMRHVVEETKTERSPIEKEIKFIEDFIELQKMRIPDRPNIKIHTAIQWDNKAYIVAPLLIIPYLENAFKYGISINNESFIDMNLTVENNTLKLACRNSIVKKTDQLEMGTGTGLENTKRRLELYYPNKYSLNVNTQNEVFEVKLKLLLT